MLRVSDDGQWHKLLTKLGDRLLLIHFSAVGIIAASLMHCVCSLMQYITER